MVASWSTDKGECAMVMYNALHRHMFRSVTDNGSGGSGSGSGTQGSQSGTTGDGDDGDTGGDADADDDPSDLEGLKAKLAHERRRRRDAERNQRRLEDAERTRTEAERKRQEEEDKNKGEWEKVAGSRERERDEWKQKAQDAEKARIEERKATALLLEASARGYADPHDALVFVDLESVTLLEDGTVKPESVASALDALGTARPYLIKAERPPGLPHTNGTSGAPPTAVGHMQRYAASRYTASHVNAKKTN